MKTIPIGVVSVRREICNRCASPCENKDSAQFHSDPCATCPMEIRQWGPYGQCHDYAPPFGLGDAVAVFAQPIARAIDAVAGTNIKECGGCKKRREALNRIVPNL